MRTLDSDQTWLILWANFGISYRVFVKDGDDVFQDLTSQAGYNWLHSVEYGESIDVPVAEATIHLHRAVYDLNLAPLDEDSLLNQDSGGSYAPLIDVGRELYIEVALKHLDAAPESGDWEEVFRGDVDEVDWSGGSEAEFVTIWARDLGGRLQDDWIEAEQDYGDDGGADDSEDVIQDILDDHAEASTTLYTPTASSYAIKKYNQRKEPILTALQNIAVLNGWVCRYKWDSVTTAFRLTLYVPDRSNTSADKQFNDSQYIGFTRLRMNRATIRNAVRVVYTNGVTKERESHLATDATSITKYGRRYMDIAEESNSLIDTAAEAQTMAEAIRDDLMEPNEELEVEMRFWPFAELGDLYQFDGNGEHFSTDQKLAVSGIRHVLSPDIQRSYFTTRGKPAGHYKVWHERSAGPGINNAPDEAAPDAPTSLAVAGIVRGLEVSVAVHTVDDFDHFNVFAAEDSTDEDDSGTATAGAAATLTDSGKSWTTDEYIADYVVLTGGTGAGQVRRILSNSATVLTVADDWATNPSTDTTYEIFKEATARKLDGHGTRWELANLNTEMVYRAWIEAEDTSGNLSIPTNYVNGTAGQAGTGDIADNAVTLEQNSLADDAGDSTTSGTWADIPGASLSINPGGTYDVMIFASLDGSVSKTAGKVTMAAEFQLLVDGVAVTGGQRLVGGSHTSGTLLKTVFGSAAWTLIDELTTGSKTIKLQYRSQNADETAICYDRHIMAVVIKK